MAENLFYHWSPTLVRKRIQKSGLMPNSLSRDGLWRPPYVCLSDDIQLAWNLSGRFHEKEEDLGPWDLWEVWLGDNKGYEITPIDGEPYRIKEVRVYERIYKRNVWLVGSRSKEILGK